MRSLGFRRDPAPSRSAYRLQRLMLTPRFWFTLKYILPVAIVLGGVAIYLPDPERRDGIALAAYEVRREIAERPEFEVKLMAIDGASPSVAEDIREIIPLDFPVSSFDLDLAQVKARAQELDAVAQAEVRIRAGGVLQITVSERTPAIIWRSTQGLELLDGEGHRVAALAARSDRPDLPLLAGEGGEDAVPEALALYQAAGPLTDRIRGLVRVGARRWDVVLDRDQRIMLPEKDAAEALARAIALDQAQEALDRDLALLDLRNPARMTVRLTATANAARNPVSDDEGN